MADGDLHISNAINNIAARTPNTALGNALFPNTLSNSTHVLLSHQAPTVQTQQQYSRATHNHNTNKQQHHNNQDR